MSGHDDGPRWVGGLLLLVVFAALVVGCGFWVAPLIQGVGR